MYKRSMSEFNELNWKNALVSVYERAMTDTVFRQLCLTNAISAILEVSDIELPAGLNVQFFDTRQDYLYTFLLPPAQSANASTNANQLITWATLCTDPTTTE